MTTQESSGALLSSVRASETTTTDTTTTTEAATETKTAETKTGDGAETATAEETKAATTDTVAAEGAETVEAENGEDNSEAEGAPETYQFEAPEGVTVDMESEHAQAFIAAAREDNLSNEKAQRYFSLFANAVQETQVATAAQQQSEWAAESGDELIDGKPSKWVQAATADALVGGTQEEMAEKLSVGKRALDQYGDAELDALMSRFNLGNNPAFLRFAYRAGLPLQEDTSVHRSDEPSAEGPKSDAEVFFPSTQSA